MDLNQITILSADVPRSVDFYRKLGLTVIVDSAPRYVRLECPSGNATLSVHHSEETRCGTSGCWLYFEVDDPDRVVRELVRAGVPFERMPEDQPWLWREARLKDPDGRTVIIYHAGKNRKDPPWKVR